MKHTVITLLKIFGGIVSTIAVLLLAAFLSMNTSWMQNYLMSKAVSVLQERLNTHVAVDHVSVQVTPLQVNLLGVEIDDQQQRKMFEMEELSAKVDLLPLLHGNVQITKASIKGLSARLYKPSREEPANFQFVIDAFKKEKKSNEPQQELSDSAKAAKKVTLGIDELTLERISVTYNQQDFTLGKLAYIEHDGKRWAEISNLKTTWIHTNKKGIKIDNRLDIGTLCYDEQAELRDINLTGVRYVTNNHLPRKNVGRPKRGFFDPGHFDVLANLQLHLLHTGKDSVAVELKECQASDRGSGFNITGLTLKAEANKQTVHLSDVSIRMKNTKLAFEKAELQIPSKKENRPLAYHTSVITGSTLLKDISRPFAPVLSKFSIPLKLKVRLSGHDDQMTFRDVEVNTADNLLNVRATGFIKNLKDKYKLQVHFDVHHMTALGGSKERIISQFPVKKFMMKQLHNLGTIGYKGYFDVLWKKEQFVGKLTTGVGAADFKFALDEKDKYVFGSVNTDSFELGRAMDMPDIGRVACKANFKFDISKPRTAKMRRLKGGKLPIGHIDAVVSEGKFKFIKVHNLVAEINSDGAVAEGWLIEKGKRMDVTCSFSFTNTNEMKKTKIKPGIRFHKMTDSAKVARAERKEIKRQEKEARKLKKAEEKEARKLKKAQEDEVKRQQKEQEKEAKRLQKEQEKEAKRLRKEQAKAEKAAAKAAKAAAKAAKAEQIVTE